MEPVKFISIQGSYSNLELALFNKNQKIDQINETSQKASSLLIPHIKTILTKNNLQLSDLDFICADQGPGAFTSLRVTISTINGIAFATKIPLIGIDGLTALAEETKHSVMLKKNKIDFDFVAPLLNAYNNEVYFYINKELHGYKKVDLLLNEIQDNFKNKKILFTGNGAILHEKTIKEIFKENALIHKQDVCSVDQIAKMALEKWEKIKDKNQFEYKLYPLYLKSQNFAIRPIKK